MSTEKQVLPSIETLSPKQNGLNLPSISKSWETTTSSHSNNINHHHHLNGNGAGHRDDQSHSRDSSSGSRGSLTQSTAAPPASPPSHTRSRSDLSAWALDKEKRGSSIPRSVAKSNNSSSNEHNSLSSLSKVATQMQRKLSPPESASNSDAEDEERRMSRDGLEPHNNRNSLRHDYPERDREQQEKKDQEQEHRNAQEQERLRQNETQLSHREHQHQQHAHYHQQSHYPPHSEHFYRNAPSVYPPTPTQQHHHPEYPPHTSATSHAHAQPQPQPPHTQMPPHHQPQQPHPHQQQVHYSYPNGHINGGVQAAPPPPPPPPPPATTVAPHQHTASATAQPPPPTQAGPPGQPVHIDPARSGDHLIDLCSGLYYTAMSIRRGDGVSLDSLHEGISRTRAISDILDHLVNGRVYDMPPAHNTAHGPPPPPQYRHQSMPVNGNTAVLNGYTTNGSNYQHHAVIPPAPYMAHQYAYMPRSAMPPITAALGHGMGSGSGPSGQIGDKRRTSDIFDDGTDRRQNRKRSRQGSGESTVCRQCGNTETPEWRRGPDGARTLCNACGLQHAKLVKKVGEIEAARFMHQKRPADVAERNRHQDTTMNITSSASSTASSASAPQIASSTD